MFATLEGPSFQLHVGMQICPVSYSWGGSLSDLQHCRAKLDLQHHTSHLNRRAFEERSKCMHHTRSWQLLASDCAAWAGLKIVADGKKRSIAKARQDQKRRWHHSCHPKAASLPPSKGEALQKRSWHPSCHPKAASLPPSMSEALQGRSLPPVVVM